MSRADWVSSLPLSHAQGEVSIQSNKKIPSLFSASLFLLVPKQSLGTPSAQLRFTSFCHALSKLDAKQSFAKWVAKQSLGTRASNQSRDLGSGLLKRSVGRGAQRYQANPTPIHDGKWTALLPTWLIP
jgi:hypothetical protein